MKKFGLLTAFTMALSLFAHREAYAEYSMTAKDILSVLESNGFSAQEAGEVALSVLGQAKDRKVTIKGVMYARGFNGACIRDTDDWALKVEIKDQTTGKMANLPGAYNVKLQNGGLVVELCYKWMFIFLTDEINASNLDGAVFGRGLGITAEVLIGIDIEALDGQNRTGWAFIVAPKIGIGGGLRFPRATFSSAVDPSSVGTITREKKLLESTKK
jgi:hypothetical protein